MNVSALEQLDTPSLILDAQRLGRNCDRMRQRIHAHGVALRPHVKTAKSVEVAQRALDAPSGPITVSTLREAEYFFDFGFRDMLYAVGLVPSKVPRVAALTKRGARVSAIVDDAGTAAAVVRACQDAGVRVPILIEIDSDGHRGGVRPGDPRLLDVARALGPSLNGVMTHAGESYNCRSIAALKDMAEQERAAVVECAGVLRRQGLACPVVSVGSTPTATFAQSFEGVSEVRTGVYMFHDLVMAGLGVCSIDDIALTVLASVIGHQQDRNRVLIDAGWMAMSRDRGTQRQAIDQGYGLVCNLDGQALEDFVVVDANQEHGIVARRDGGAIDFARFPVGSRVRILPNHACATAAQHSEYHVLREDGSLDIWERFSGW